MGLVDRVGGVTESNVSQDSYSFLSFLPCCDDLFIKRDGKEAGGKGEEKKLQLQLLFQLDPIRQVVGRDVLAFAATLGLIILLCRAICLTEKLLRRFTSTSNSDMGRHKYQKEEIMSLGGGTDTDAIY